jgi:hypothetical protein
MPRYSARQASIRGRKRNPSAPGDLPPALALSAQQQSLVAPEYPARPSKTFAAPLCRTNAGSQFIPDEFALELVECAGREHIALPCTSASCAPPLAISGNSPLSRPTGKPLPSAKQTNGQTARLRE